MESTVINIEQTDFNTDCKLVACCSCGMYQYFSLSYLKLHYNLTTDAHGGFTYTCMNCHEKYSLLQQVDELRTVNNKLNDRISSLIQLKEAEESFDRTLDSMGYLTEQFANINLSSNIPNPSQHITVPLNVVSDLSQHSNATSVWNSFSDPQSETLPKGYIAQQPAIQNQISSNTSSITINSSVLSRPESNGEEALTDKSETTPPQLTDPKLLSKVKVIGDSNLKHVNIGEYRKHDNSILKIVHPNITINKTHKAVKYLVTKMHKCTETVIAHVGVNDINQKRSVKMSEDFIAFAEFMETAGKRLVISGPIPKVAYNSEAFSRLLAFNIWLSKWTEERGLVFIDNFDRFWKRAELFHDCGKILNRIGSLALSNHIRSCVKHLL